MPAQPPTPLPSLADTIFEKKKKKKETPLLDANLLNSDGLKKLEEMVKPTQPDSDG